MIINCPHCARNMDFSGEPPRFCSYCGQSLNRTVSAAGPVVSLSEAATHPPSPFTPDTGIKDPDATLPPDAPGAGLIADDPKVIGGYKLIRRLGSGGMGTVYEAEDANTKQRVALKLIARAFAANPEVVKRFHLEGKLASKLAHPRCVFILAADEDQGRPYLVMELMPGPTLSDYVKQKGPLPVTEAVLKILDVIEGLLEVHRLGLVHRDVKPSNCFLESNGRVKVADFGLAKSLVHSHLGETSAHLTKTGAFLGTPLYASPEQVKAEKVDQQADVYAVAATLYFLLTGKAPFEGAGDPMAILAQIVSDDPKPPSELRYDIPLEMDAVILRALERDKKRRYASLREFRTALLPFTPHQPDIVGLGLRFGAYVLDYLFFSLILGMIAVVLTYAFGIDLKKPSVISRLHWPAEAATFVLFLFYFAVPEKWFGCTLAKLILRLRVCQVKHAALPRYWQALVRSLAFFFFVFFLKNAYDVLVPPPAPSKNVSGAERQWQILMHAFTGVGVVIAGWVVIWLPMRRRNGYRGLHEWLSGTRTIRLPGKWIEEKSTVLVSRDSLPMLQPEDSPHEIGPYVVHGCHRWEPTQQILLGEDSSLGRLVWIWRRPAHTHILVPHRREISRVGRWRWLSSGADDDWIWDVFLASPGASLTAVVKRTGPSSWKQARPLLLALSQELVEACADGTLPEDLSPAQVWLQANGGVQLLDMNPEPETVLRAMPVGKDDEKRALAFLAEVAVLMLEGKPLRDKAPRRIHAPLPLHVLKLVNHLLNSDDPQLTLAKLTQELLTVMDKPAEVTRTWRVWHFALHGFTLLLAGLLFQAVAQNFLETTFGEQTRGVTSLGLPLFFCCCIAWSLLTRGGLMFRWLGLGLCRGDGQQAYPLQCAWRTLLVGAPYVVLIVLRELMPIEEPLLGYNPILLSFQLAVIVYFAFVLIWMIVRPQRGWHDIVAGTYVVPR